MHESLIIPDWPAPPQVRAAITTRKGGASQGPYESFNLAAHGGDEAEHVAQNRLHLQTLLHLPQEPYWLSQVHGTRAVLRPLEDQREADASLTRNAGILCAVLTADCLPLLLCNEAGNEVAAIHAGWKGLAAGIIEATLERMESPPETILVYLGPAISQRHFEVGQEVYEAFVNINAAHQQAFCASGKGKYQADLYQLARQKLAAKGIHKIYGANYCTYAQKDLFYSFRRDQGVTGRMASLIYFQ